MTFPTPQTIGQYIAIIISVLSALIAAFWLSTVIWAFRDMRLRSRDPFAQILAALLVAAIPFIGAVLYLILRPPETLAERYERALEEEALLQEIEERPRCHKCNRIVDDEWAMCPSCHVELKKQCPACFNLLELGWQRCPHCTAAQPKERPALTPERLLPTVHKQVGLPSRPTPASLPAPIAAPIAPVANGNGNGQESRVFRRRIRKVKVGGNGNGSKPTTQSNKVVVGSSHPTIMQLPTVDGDSPVQQYRREIAEGNDEATVFNMPTPDAPVENGITSD